MQARLLTASIAVAAVVTSLVATASPASAARFQTPSKNIACALDRGGVRCDIAKRDWSPPPKPASCPVDWGQGLTLGRSGNGSYVCAGDTVLGAGRTLGYGKAVAVGRFRCVSRESGVRCTNKRNGHGFSLSRQRAERF